MQIKYVPLIECDLCFSQLRPIDISIEWPGERPHYPDVEEPHIWVTLECKCYWRNDAIEYEADENGDLYPKGHLS